MEGDGPQSYQYGGGVVGETWPRSTSLFAEKGGKAKTKANGKTGWQLQQKVADTENSGNHRTITRGEAGRGGVIHFMHSRSLKTIDPRIPTMPEWKTGREGGVERGSP